MSFTLKVVKWVLIIVSLCEIINQPLTVNKAAGCLRDLVEKIKSALDELHSYNLSHNDVRLENTCFNGQYNAVLIDLDN